jgi:uncharacterized protein YjcR
MGVKAIYNHDEIIRLYQEGMYYKDIAERIGCSYPTVSCAITKWKNKEKKKATEVHPELDTGKIRALAWGGWSLKDIADEVGCSTEMAAEVIRRWINGR